MIVFIGSSKEQESTAKEIAYWLEDDDVQSIVWSEPEVFIPGKYTLEALNNVSATVDAAIFVFATDDTTYSRNNEYGSVRDNVLLEYGLFSGKLSRENVIVVKVGDPKIPSDLTGITLIPLETGKERRAKRALENWVKSINKDAPKVEKINIKSDNLNIFDSSNYADLIYKIKTDADRSVEVTVDYEAISPIIPAFSGIVVNEGPINISSAKKIIIEFSFLGGLSKLDLEIKNPEENLLKKFSITPDMIVDNKCYIDIPSTNRTKYKNVKEIVLCSKPTYFSDPNHKIGSFKIKSIMFH